MSHRIYLGDSVYASYDCGQIRLCTNNGFEDENVLFLEPEVYEALVSWRDAIKRSGS